LRTAVLAGKIGREFPIRQSVKEAPMSDTPAAGGSPANNLQFDRAEYQTPNVVANCRICGQPMTEAYYEVNGQPFCEGCREQLDSVLNRGSRFSRFALATLFGSLAGLVGAAIYYGVREATKIEFGLISIVVGLLVGKAVKKGSNGRGGWFYQGLAMFLTYTAIMLTYVPPLLKIIAEKADKKADAAKVQDAAKPADADPPEDAKARPRPTVGGLVVALAILIGIAYAIPVLVGFQSPMSLVIIGIGLYEAWVINRRARLTINGPYRIGPASTGIATHVEPAR
jgi:hypothetical protein